MQMVKNIILFSLSLIIFLLLTAPLKELYYYFEHKLVSQNIVINNEKIEDGFLHLGISDADILYNNIDIAHFNKADVLVLFVYNRVDIIGIELSMKGFIPLDIKSANIEYALWNPFGVDIKLYGSFGEAGGEYDIDSKTLKIYFYNEDKIDSIKRYLKRDEEGYYYEFKL